MTHELEQLRIEVSRKSFNMVFRVITYLAVPALGGAFLGKYLDSRYGTEDTWSFVCLGLAFVFSWSIIILDYRRLGDDIRRLEELERQYPGKNK